MYVGDEPARKKSFCGRHPDAEFMGKAPEEQFLGGDLLVIEGLDHLNEVGQPIGPYEPDYRPDLVPWVTKPSTNHFAAYRRAKDGRYWGPGNQYLPGFPPAHLYPECDIWPESAIAGIHGIDDLGLHEEAEQERALAIAKSQYRVAKDAKTRGQMEIFNEQVGFLRGVKRLAEVEGAARLETEVHRMIQDLG